MKKIIFICAALLGTSFFMARPAGALGETLVYHEYAGKGAGGTAGETLTGEMFVQFTELPDGQTSISRKKQGGNCRTDDEFILDRNYSLERWKRICLEEDTDFLSVREGDILTVKGKLKGEIIDKQIELGGKALYIYPKYHLAKFALSDMKKIKFWTLRRDKMKKLPMQAIKKGTKTIMVNGEEVEAIKVYYSITGKLREKHYNHDYYYRKSDGLFIKKEWSKGKIEELVKEE